MGGTLMKRTASCCCGQLSLTYDQEIKRVSICHCYECQRRTGSAFGIQTRLDRDKVEIRGTATKYQRTGDDPADGHVIFSFCPTCGSTVYYELSGMPDSYVVPVGAFADQTLPAPIFSVYEDRMHPWVKLPESIETHLA
jgi:hypothetical protein